MVILDPGKALLWPDCATRQNVGALDSSSEYHLKPTWPARRRLMVVRRLVLEMSVWKFVDGHWNRWNEAIDDSFDGDLWQENVRHS